MGMFDYIKCEVPLPDGFDPERFHWQTKDTPAQSMDTYRITPDGQLIHESTHYEITPKDQMPYPDEPGIRGMAGCLTRVSDGDVVLDDFHGDIVFYMSNWAAWMGDVFATHNDEPWCSREYLARFSNGRLQGIILVNAEDGVCAGCKHLPRDEYHKEVARRKAMTDE